MRRKLRRESAERTVRSWRYRDAKFELVAAPSSEP
jgi:hypothetical protein